MNRQFQLAVFKQMNNINDLEVNQDQDFQVVDEQESQKIVGGVDTAKKIRLPYKKFPPGGAGCPACLSGLDPRYNSTK